MDNIVNVLSKKLSLHSDDMANAGEYLMQQLDGIEDADVLEDILLTILMHHRRWNDNGSNFNQDYRRRLIRWFTDKEGISPVLQAGVTELMVYDSQLLSQSVIDLKQLENRQKPSAPCTERQELKLWLIKPELEKERGHAITSVMERKEKLYRCMEYLHFFRERIAEITFKSRIPAEKALSALIQENIFSSAKSAQYGFLLKHYTDLEIAALNLYFYMHENDIKSDNIKVCFLQCLSGITETEELDEFKLSMIKKTIEGSFNRYITNYKKCSTWFRHKLMCDTDTEEEFHVIFQSDEEYRKFYNAMKPVVDFRHTGYLRFDPLLPENRKKWEIIQYRDRMHLLDYRAGAFLTHDPHAVYSREQQKQIEGLHGLAKELYSERESPGSQITLPEFLAGSIPHALTVFLQAGLETMLTPIKNVRNWYDSLEPACQYLYALKLWRETRQTSHSVFFGWGQPVCQKAHSLLHTAAQNPYLTDDEKKQFFFMVQDAVWIGWRDQYPDFLYGLLTLHKDLAARFLDEKDLAEIAKELCRDRPDLLLKLADYLMSREEMDAYIRLEERKKEETKKEKELIEFQKDVKDAIHDLIDSGNTWKIGFLADDCLNEAITKIAVRNEVEKWDGENISQLIYTLAKITSKTKIHSVLLQAVQDVCSRQKGIA